jgi:Uma2 family endonuclease
MNRGAIVLDERLRIPANVFSLEKFRAWAHSEDFPDRGRFSYIGGEIEVEMSPEEIETHNKVKVYCSGGLLNWIQGKNLGELLGDRAFLVNKKAGLATEADIVFCGWDSLRSGRVRYSERKEGSRRYVEVVGSPDVVVEIVSESSVHKDTVLLRDRYFRAGIEEYWLIDARGVDIDFRILERGKSEYVETAADGEGYRRSDVLGASFLLTRSLNPVGGFAYRLLVRG